VNKLIFDIVKASEGDAETEFEAFVNRSSHEQLQKTLDALGSSSTVKTKSVAYSGMLKEYNDLEAECDKMIQAKTQINTAMM